MARFFTPFGMTKGGLYINIHSGFQPSEQGLGIDIPPLRDGAEIYRAFSPCALCGPISSSPFEGGEGDVPLRSDTVYPA